MSRPITRSFILHLIHNCPEAKVALSAWQAGDLTFEEAMMEVVKCLFLAKQDLQRQYDYIPPHVRAIHKPRD